MYMCKTIIELIIESEGKKVWNILFQLPLELL
jgi:hypothetical protein